MNKVKNFFVKVWEWLKKAYRVCRDFLKENVWASVLLIVVSILLFIIIVQGIVKAVDKWQSKEEESSIENRSTVLTTSQLMTKLENKESFVLFLGANTCAHCKQFYKTVNTYIKSGNTVYYVDLADTSDPTLNKYYYELVEKLDDIPDDRNITDLSTPLSIYVKDGVFTDAVQGAFGMSGGTEYATWCDVMEGVYEGKPTHGLGGSTTSSN